MPQLAQLQLLIQIMRLVQLLPPAMTLKQPFLIVPLLGFPLLHRRLPEKAGTWGCRHLLLYWLVADLQVDNLQR